MQIETLQIYFAVVRRNEEAPIPVLVVTRMAPWSLCQSTMGIAYDQFVTYRGLIGAG